MFLRLALIAFAVLAAAPVWAAAGPERAAAWRDSVLLAGTAAYDSLLRERVRNGLVDYEAILANDLPRLDRALNAFARVRPNTLAGDERVAYEVNLYNAAMIRAVCDRWNPGWTAAADDFAVFKSEFVRYGPDQMVSLDELEKQIVMPREKNPYLHVAFMCAARSCPLLLPRAYRGSDLRATLEVSMRRFVRDPLRNRVDPKTNAMALSRIFDWYADDFGGAAAVPAFVARYARTRADRWTVTFLEYDWALNGTTTP